MVYYIEAVERRDIKKFILRKGDIYVNNYYIKILNERIIMKIFRITELQAHDVFEFCYSNRFPNHWNDDSLFVAYDEFIVMYPYIKKIIPNYKCYSPQKVSFEQWTKIKALFSDKQEYKSFFKTIEHWIKDCPCQSDYFWIYGV